MADCFDQSHMRRALELALEPVCAPHPNPRVGCVIARGGEIIAEGFHQAAGSRHAEAVALDGAGDVAGATMYITLEPCATHGRMPPCVERVAASGVARVVMASEDPNPVNRGLGITRLQTAGIKTKIGMLDAEARQINKGFFARHERGRCWVTAKVATTLDGRIAAANGESQWITGPAAREDVHRLRAQAAAVVTGIGTLMTDNPRLNCRATGANGQPLRVVVDSTLKTPPSARMFSVAGEVLIAVGRQAASHRIAEMEKVAKVAVFESGDGRVDCRALMNYLSEQQINEVLVEAGPTLVGALLEADLIDELITYIAPSMLGDSALGAVRLPGVRQLAERVAGEFTDVRQIGDDLRVVLNFTKDTQRSE